MNMYVESYKIIGGIISDFWLKKHKLLSNIQKRILKTDYASVNNVEQSEWIHLSRSNKNQESKTY